MKTVELLAPHTHQGQRRQKGERLTLRNEQAELLIKAGFAKKVQPAAQSTLEESP